ncbi:MAG: hemin uptake protein HemP [Methylovirgula sp.]
MADERNASSPSGGQKSETREIDVRELIGETKEVILLHAGERYRLRITANDKLILTK